MVRIDNDSQSFTFSKKAIETNKEQQNNTPISVFGDKNNNGVIDNEDFNKEDLEKLENTKAFSLFKDLKWSENISKIFTALLNKGDNGENSEETISEIQQLGFSVRHIQYNKSSKTLKFASQSPDDYNFSNYYEFDYDEKGRIKKSRVFDSDSPKYYKDGKTYSIGREKADTYIRSLGFDVRKSTPEQETAVNKLFADNEDFFINKTNYEYDENGNIKEINKNRTCSAQVDNEGKIKGRKEIINKEDGTITEIEYDRENNIIAKNKVIYDTVTGSLKETYDCNDTLLYKTKIESKEDEDGKWHKTAIREFANGNIYKEEDSNKEGPKVELKDANGKILEKYEIKRIAGRYYRFFPDGHKEDYDALIDN